MIEVPPASSDIDEVSAANLVNDAIRGKSCAQAADALRLLSNQVLSLGTMASQPPISGRPDPEFKRKWREHIRSPQFWRKVWDRMANAYMSCNRGCFDDGLAVGQISATAYCSASVALDGLPGAGYLEQTPLPVCETAIFAGCLQSYQNTATSFPGCGPYTTDSYQRTFYEYQSQDCHL